jgi:hypothetical protein
MRVQAQPTLLCPVITADVDGLTQLTSDQPGLLMLD